MGSLTIPDAPVSPDYVRFQQGFGQRFVVTIDVEEEFDWTAPIDRHKHTIETIPKLARFQQFCEKFGIIPIYLVDYPVASCPEMVSAIGAAVKDKRAEAGIQLHPWVSPPHDEEISNYNSFAGNLPPELERAKFELLRDTIETAFGETPIIYRAGRYGAGATTADILADNKVAIDTSVRSHFDYAATGGPNYSNHPLQPYWLNKAKGLMELPLTTVFWGPLRRQGSWLYPRLWRLPLMRGVLSKLGLLERVSLTPEGIAADDACRAIDVAIDDQLPVLVFSFHSPSLAAGHTPYVRTEADLDRFYDWWRTIFTYLEKRGVTPTSATEIVQSAVL